MPKQEQSQSSMWEQEKEEALLGHTQPSMTVLTDVFQVPENKDGEGEADAK